MRYFGLINCKNQINEMIVEKMNLTNNTCDSLYGGGVGFLFMGISTLRFNNCYLKKNKAIQNKSTSRPNQENGISYYNGDGGGIQLGYFCLTNEMNIIFNECFFGHNMAQRHGGAISIQTTKEVKIENCKFVSNFANCDFDLESNLLFENHFNKKSYGKGGAIYINPAYSYDDSENQCQQSDKFMTNVTISGSEFSCNKADDGFAIYIEGDDPGTTFIIRQNTFNDNYGENHYIEDINTVSGAVITTEIHSLVKSQIIEDNNFFYTQQIFVKELSYVDHYGIEIKQSSSNIFSKTNFFTKSTEFSKSKEFTNSKIFSKSNHFTQSIHFTESEIFSGQIGDITPISLFFPNI